MTIADKLEKIESTKAKIENLAPQKDWDDAFFRKIKIDFTYFTNKLEGSTLTYGQTLKLLKDFVTPQHANPGELLDMINHQKVLDSVFVNYRSQTLSEENIKELHGQLMKDIAQWSDDSLYSPGRYKSFESELLVTVDDPTEARPHVHIGFESQETVDRESKGNWWHHFK